MGAYGVGKTCLLRQFTQGSFEAKHTPTIGVDFQNKTVNCGGDTIRLQIWDSAGQERFEGIAVQYFGGSQGIIVVFDVTDRPTFERAEWWLSNLRGKYAKEIPNIDLSLVGNKSDLPEAVSESEALSLASRYNAKYTVVSAKKNENVVELFSELATRIAARAAAPPEPESTPIAATRKPRTKSAGGGCCSSRPRR